MRVQFHESKAVSQDTVFLCNQYEHEAAYIEVNIVDAYVNDSYYYYIACKSPLTEVNEFVVPLLLEYNEAGLCLKKIKMVIGSDISSTIGDWQFSVIVKSATDETIAVSDYFTGKVKSGILKPGQLEEQVIDVNLSLLYDNLLTLGVTLRSYLDNFAALEVTMLGYTNAAAGSASLAASDLIIVQDIKTELIGLLATFNTNLDGFNIDKSDFDNKYSDTLIKYSDFIAKYEDFISKYSTFSTKYDDFLVKYAQVVEDAGQVASDKTIINGILSNINTTKGLIDGIKSDIDSKHVTILTKVTEAGTSALNAATSETNAHTSETKAKTSETNAGASEINAKTSETNAGASEINAKTSETNAAAAVNNHDASETSHSDIRSKLADLTTDLAEYKLENVLELADLATESTMPHIMDDLQNEKQYKYGYRLSADGIPQIISEEVV